MQIQCEFLFYGKFKLTNNYFKKLQVKMSAGETGACPGSYLTACVTHK